ncbi:MAG TPA: hypothetical protein VGX92_21105 [Pyrinomonadaceae bacterium]|jgi:hypothetical protein|nr:hypothetical protein [Pyrinomonadaceae bacterium]
MPLRAYKAALCLIVWAASGHALGPARASSASSPSPQISYADRIRLAEAFRIGAQLGNKLWKGWSRAPFAVLLVTPDYEFLVRHPRPSQDFSPAGYDPLLKSEVYFRKRVYEPNLLATFPAVNGISTIVVGQPSNTDAKASTRWVVTLLHEHFHQLQDSQTDFYAAVNALDLSRGDESGMWMLNFAFPYEDKEIGRQFETLCRALGEALRAASPEQYKTRLGLYLEARARFKAMLGEDDYKYFSFQLWKEGVARYTEYRIAKLAAERYRPSKEFAALADFQPFEQDAAHVSGRITSGLASPSLEKERRVAFYAFGAAEAMLLDRANPGWRQRYFKEKFSLEKFFRRKGSPSARG